MPHSILPEVSIMIMSVSLLNSPSILVPQTVPVSVVPKVEGNNVFFQAFVNV